MSEQDLSSSSSSNGSSFSLPSISSTSSSAKEEEASNDEGPSVDEAREKLIKTAEMDRLTEVLDLSLTQAGWKTDILNILRAEIQKNGQNLTLEDLFESVREKALDLLPSEVEQEMIERIQESYAKDSSDDEESPTDLVCNGV